MDVVSTAPSRLLYTTGTRRGLYVRFFLRALLGVLAALALGLAANASGEAGRMSPLLANCILLVAIAFGLWFSTRLVIQLVRVFNRRSVTVRLYDKGFVWFEGERAAKHRWAEVIRFREGAKALRLFGRPLIEWGAQVITVEDGNEYRFTPALGDSAVFAEYVRPYCARVTSVRMGKALRTEQPVQLSKRLTIYPGGVAVGKTEVPWAELRVTVDPGWKKIILRRLQPGMKPRVVARIPVSDLDNAAGFVEIARPQIESFSQRID